MTPTPYLLVQTSLYYPTTTPVINGRKVKFSNLREEKVYNTIQIGKQVWMAENLSISKYRNGDPIPHVPHDTKWGDLKRGGWCYYNNDPKNDPFLGKLYNWHAVNDPRGLAPKGFHIPTDKEWKTLELHLGMGEHFIDITGWRGSLGGRKLKEASASYWKKSNEGATNESGFTALPGGYRDVDGTFFTHGTCGYWWSSSEYTPFFAWYRSLYFSNSGIHRSNGYEGDGFSVRCIMDSGS